MLITLIKNIKQGLKDLDKPLLFFTLILLGFGTINLVSSSSNSAIAQGLSAYYYFYKQALIIVLALFLGLIVIGVATKDYFKPVVLLYCILLCMLFYLYFEGVSIRGAKNWLPIFGISFQPSEFLKPVIIVLLALIFDRYQHLLSKPSDQKILGISNPLQIGIILIVGLVPPLMVALSKDLGSAAIMLAIFGVLFLFSPIKTNNKFKTTALVVVVGVIALVGIYLVKGTLLTTQQASRLDYLDPCSKYEVNGYQVCNAFIAINNGGLWGVGPGKSTQKYSYINDAYTDSVFAIIVEEYGFVFSLVIFSFYLIIFKRILAISSHATTVRGRFITLGTAVYLMAHIILNLGGLFGLIPLTGVPLPFFSYGGSFTVSMIIALAACQRVSIETKQEKIKIAH